MVGYIYLTKNIINDKKYVGKKYGKFDIKYYGSGLILKQSLKKYGKNNFIVELLEYCQDENTLNDREIYYIQKISPEYNIAEGGIGGNTLKNASEEYKNKIIKKRNLSLKNKWKSLTEEEKEKWKNSISKSKKGKKYKRENYKHSLETKIKISNSNKLYHNNRPDSHKEKLIEASKKRKGIPNKNCYKKVFINDKSYDSFKQASEDLKVSRQTINNWVKKGKAKLC